MVRVLALWVCQRVAFGQYTDQPKQPCVERVQASGEEEASKVLMVTPRNTGAHPWTVMVMHLDAGVARATVEGPWRSHYLTGLAIGQKRTFHFEGKPLPAVHLMSLSFQVDVSEVVSGIKLLNRNRTITKRLVAHIDYCILFDLVVALYCGDYSWVCRVCLVQHVQS